MSELKVSAEKSAEVVAMFAGDMAGRVRECGALGGLDAKSGASGAKVYEALCAPLGADAKQYAGFSQSTVEKALGAYRLAHKWLSADEAPKQYKSILGAANAETVGALTDAWGARIAKANAKSDAERVALLASALKDAAKANAEKAQKAKDAAKERAQKAKDAEAEKARAEAEAAEKAKSEGEEPKPEEPANAEPEGEEPSVAEKILTWLRVSAEALGALSAEELQSVSEAALSLASEAAERGALKSAEAAPAKPAPKPRAPRAPRAPKVSASA